MITQLMEELGYSVSMLSAATGKYISGKTEETREQEKVEDERNNENGEEDEASFVESLNEMQTTYENR